MDNKRKSGKPFADDVGTGSRSVLLLPLSQRIETILELLAKPERGIVDDFMGVALADVQGDDLTVLRITVDEGDIVEQTEVLLRVL